MQTQTQIQTQIQIKDYFYPRKFLIKYSLTKFNEIIESRKFTMKEYNQNYWFSADLFYPSSIEDLYITFMPLPKTLSNKTIMTLVELKLKLGL